jgi:hypothetical protein
MSNTCRRRFAPHSSVSTIAENRSCEDAENAHYVEQLHTSDLQPHVEHGRESHRSTSFVISPEDSPFISGRGTITNPRQEECCTDWFSAATSLDREQLAPRFAESI